MQFADSAGPDQLSAYRINGYFSICRQTDQTVWMRMLIWTYVVRKLYKGPFPALRVICIYMIQTEKTYLLTYAPNEDSNQSVRIREFIVCTKKLCILNHPKYACEDSACLFVLRFYGLVNPMESCRERSIYLTTRLLGRLSPLSGQPVLCTFFRQKLTTAHLESAEGRE